MGAGAVAGKTDEFVWMLNNIITGGISYGLSTGGYNQATKGNIIYDSGHAHNTMLYVNTKRGDGVVVHNTVLQSLHGRNPVGLTDPANGDREEVRVQFTHNIVGHSEHTSEGSSFMKVDLPPAVAYSKETAGTTIVAAFDNNFYLNLEAGAAAGVKVANKLTLAEWQEQTTFDANSGDGDVPGVSVPDSTVYVESRVKSPPTPTLFFG